MKIKETFFKAVSVVLSIVFVVASSVTVLAADTAVNFIITPEVYSHETGTYFAQDTFKSDEIFYLKVSATQISRLGGMAFTVQYDNARLDFLKNKSVCAIDDSTGDTQYYLNEANNQLRVSYDSGAYNIDTAVTGAVYYLAFQAKDFTENISVPITFTLNELYDNTFSQNDIEANLTAAATIYLVTETISDETLKLFQKLETIKYPDSKDDIDAAREAFNLLSTAQKKLLSQKYPSEYEWLSSAYTRYNALAEKANKDAILSEIENFKKQYSKVLKLTTKTVTIADEKSVNSASKSYENCSAAAKSHLQSEAKLIKALAERITELKEIQTEIDDFLSNEAMKILWNDKILDYSFSSTYIEYLPAIQLALTSYDLLSDEAKEALKSEYEWVKKLNEEAQKYAALDEAAKKLAEELAQFQKTYLNVFTLNQNNVSESDRTAIEMVISAWEALENEELKQALTPLINNLHTMLEILDELAAEDEEESETVYVEVPGKTVTKIETEYVTQTETQTEYITKNDTLASKVVKIINQKTAMSKLILILFILLAVAITVHGVITILCDHYRKRCAALIMNEEEADL